MNEDVAASTPPTQAANGLDLEGCLKVCVLAFCFSEADTKVF